MGKIVKLLILLVLVCLPAFAGVSSGKLQGRVLDATSVPLPGARVQATQEESGAAVVAQTDGDGRFSMELPDGPYLITASLDGFQPVSTRIASIPANALEFVLPMQQNLAEDVTVTGGTEPLLVKEETTRKEKLDDAVLDYVPIASQRFQDALPLVPSVVRGPDGNINISGARASENSLLVNGANVTDPVTGSFAIELPMEAVETVDVYTNPYSAEFGKFTGGITSISTRPGEDKFRVQFNDFVPRFHFIDGLKTEGVEAWRPRIRVSGPTGINHLYFSQAFQYQYLRTFYDDLPEENNQNVTKLTAFDSLTQFDYLPDSTNQWSATLSFFPEDTDNVNLNTFLPVASTPDFKQRGFNLGLSQRHFLSEGSFVESLFGYKSYNVSIIPKTDQGSFEITPQGMLGGFFNEQDRDSSRIQWSETLTLRPFSWLGAHQLKVGSEWNRSEYSGTIAYKPVEVLRMDGSLAELDEFSGPGQIGAAGQELGLYVQDHWQPASEWTFDAGMRSDYSNLSHEWNWSPRIAFSYAPTALPHTAVKGGAGIFYDKIFLNAFDFEEYPVRTITTYGEQGEVTGSTVLQPRLPGNLQSPSSLTWNLEIDQEISSGLLLRLNYVMRDGRDQLVVDPVGSELRLSNNGESRYRQWELTTRYKLSNESQVFFSYIHSTTRGDLNDFDTYFGNFQKPLIRENDFGFLPFDATHRFLSWGVVKVPGKVYLSPVLEIRSGFRYSAVNELQQYVGERNSLRFPVFTQLDLRITRTFEVLNKYKVMLGLKVFNLLNQFNPRDVQNNLGSPAFGTFYNGAGRTLRAAFEIQY